MTDAISDGRCLYYLRYLLEFLAAWEKRPVCLTPMAYQWCSAISEVAKRSEMSTSDRTFIRLQLRNLQNPPSPSERGFSDVGRNCDPIRSDTAHNVQRQPQDLHPDLCAHLLSITLDIGFRHVTPSYDQPALHLDHTSHHEWVFESAFSSGDGDDDGNYDNDNNENDDDSNSDDVIADAVCVWIAGGDNTPPGSCARYFAKRVEKDTPFSPRLRQASICVIDRIWHKELEVSELETIRWLDRLEIYGDDITDRLEWVQRLVAVIRSPTGLENLSSHYWCLLAEVVVGLQLFLTLEPCDVGVVESL